VRKGLGLTVFPRGTQGLLCWQKEKKSNKRKKKRGKSTAGKEPSFGKGEQQIPRAVGEVTYSNNSVGARAGEKVVSYGEQGTSSTEGTGGSKHYDCLEGGGYSQLSLLKQEEKGRHAFAGQARKRSAHQ